MHARARIIEEDAITEKIDFVTPTHLISSLEDNFSRGTLVEDFLRLIRQKLSSVRNT